MNHHRYKYLLLLMLSPLFGCAEGTPDGWRLPPFLAEVSGLAAHEGRLLMHDDEVGNVFLFDPGSGDIEPIATLNVRDDFEGVAIFEGQIIVVNSTGLIYQMPVGGNAATKTMNTGLQDICEVEGLDVHGNQILLACKTNYVAKQSRLLIYSYEPATASLKQFMNVSLKEWDVGKFAPSALAVKNDLVYLLSAKPKKLLVMTMQGEVQQVVRFESKRHPQPEGLAWLDNVLYIANEDKKGGTITTFSNPLGTSQ